MSSTARKIVRTYAVADLAAPVPRKHGRAPGSHNTKKQTGQPSAKESMEVERATSPVSATEDIDNNDGTMPAAPAPRKRGRPPGSRNTKQKAGKPPAKKSKVADNTPIVTSSASGIEDVNDIDSTAPEAPAPRKRGRPPGVHNATNRTGQPPAKKLKVADNVPITMSPMQTTAENSDVEMPASPSPKHRAQHQIVVPARSPLPACSNRVTNPGAPDQRRARQTSAEVAAANKAKMDLKDRLEQLERQKIEALAALEVEEELDDNEEKQASINNISDLNHLHSDDEENYIVEGEEGNPDDKEEPTLIKAPAKKSSVVRFIV